MTSSLTPESVLDFWLGDGIALGWPSQNMGKRWFTGGPELDAQIRQLFGAQVELALDGGLVDWEADPLHRLALVILLDQFPRNIFRGQARAFAGDARAQQLVSEALAQGLDEHLPWVGRMFLHMPLMHAEDLDLQEECVHCFTRLVAAVPAELRATITGSLRFAEQHRDIIARLGRFPYRNAALGRSSTAQDIEFLQNGPRFGQ